MTDPEIDDSGPRDPEMRAAWRWRWLDLIEGFGDLEDQRRFWLANDRYYTFVELMCQYFDDLAIGEDDGGLESAVEYGLVTPAEFEAVHEFHRLAERYEAPNGDARDHEAILADPRWHEVCAVAAQAGDRLREIVTDPEDLRALATKENREIVPMGSTPSPAPTP